MPILLADLGNSVAHWARWQDGALLPLPQVAQQPVPDFEAGYRQARGEVEVAIPSRVVFVSVNPKSTVAFQEWVHRRFSLVAQEVGREIAVPLINDTRRPDQVGKDRLVAAYAAHRRTRATTMVVDLGTAITCDLVTQEGHFLGGMIAPGLHMGLKALHAGAALLPATSYEPPKSLIGKETVEAMRAGVFYACVGLIECAARRAETFFGAPVPVIISGGDAPAVARELRVPATHVPDLVLKGLAALVEGNEGEC